MGGGAWYEDKFATYSCYSKMGYDTSTGRAIVGNEQLTKIKSMNDKLNPYNVVRECCDSEEHPNTVPVILALDVTGSMGSASIEVASELGNIMKELYKNNKDVEFMIMGIGDFYCDKSPLQVSQFESDIRIAEQLDLLYHEHGGGSNDFESYTAAWAFGLYNCNLDCWKRGKKGIIITMGDETINPYIDYDEWKRHVGDSQIQTKDGFIMTDFLYKEATKKYNLFHINVAHGYRNCPIGEWKAMIGKDHVVTCEVSNIAQEIVGIINSCKEDTIPTEQVQVDENGAIGW